MPAEAEPPLDIERILEALDRHGVDYLVVGGVAASAYGASRMTNDFDCVAERSRENLDRLAAAMRELGARLRAEGLTDAESQQLPVRIDGKSLGRMEISTWTTDAGWFDVLTDMPNRGGEHLRYEQLAPRALTVELGGVTVRLAALEDVISSKEWADRPKDHDALPELHAMYDRLARAEQPPGPSLGTGSIDPSQSLDRDPGSIGPYER